MMPTLAKHITPPLPRVLMPSCMLLVGCRHCGDRGDLQNGQASEHSQICFRCVRSGVEQVARESFFAYVVLVTN
ncbi:hypothetical protein K432DRAFT_134213 [Lepidopterella palustris CBS 459.81]|uniref:Uncharacterized protein n=1 Tax=Lepidopterella palustris CBS 459.81 TaxID=1314670 RepID=A0A8E2JJ24_9PEZI|nr:hypothetical protein K432DRAFT_134213 [Lepidopterella palustris CBS 459.81]